MSTISELSDDLLVKILSHLPTKVAVSTSVLAKKWQFLWMWSPNLELCNTHGSESEILQSFLQRNLPLYRAPIIKRFSLHLPPPDIDPEEIKLWIQFAVSRDVRELDIFHSSDNGEDYILPSSLYTCKSLVTLELYNDIYIDVPPMVCLPSLKTLRLHIWIYDQGDSLPLLLSNCPVLEDLSMCGCNDLGKLIVRVPSLQRLSVSINRLDEFVIDTSSLEYLELKTYCRHKHMYISIKNMPKLKEAFVAVEFSLFDKLIRCIPSVKRLTICLSFDNISEVVFDDGFVFNKLKHLKLCICQGYSWYVLVQLLKASPNLQVLELVKMKYHGEAFMVDWNPPSTVPECLLSSLETFKWSKYEGGEEERKLVIYILENAHCLNTATILNSL